MLISLSIMILATLLSGCQSASNDGEIISKELIKVPGQNPKVNIYQVFYYSEGTKVEALLTEPIWSGEYPLVVNLHGGRLFREESITHYDFGYTAESISKASHRVITLYPNYRGYMESEGHVQGLADSTLDAQNAVKAAKSMLGKKIKADSTYLLGYSFGGGVALRMASERRDVKAVAAVSPFVGSDEYIRWLDENPKNSSILIAGWRNNLRDLNDDVHKNNGSLLDRIPDIEAPVLFLQGTGDANVIWQTVQQYADDMEKVDKTVNLVMFPNGNHALDDQNREAANEEIVQWFQKYGLSKW
ncbi:alpha/beta hydrolase family protein [Cohnella thailandensis]|nr:alpha/beta fold hydrolase [Cohnella thailandensis]